MSQNNEDVSDQEPGLLMIVEDGSQEDLSDSEGCLMIAETDEEEEEKEKSNHMSKPVLPQQASSLSFDSSCSDGSPSLKPSLTSPPQQKLWQCAEKDRHFLKIPHRPSRSSSILPSELPSLLPLNCNVGKDERQGRLLSKTEINKFKITPDEDKKLIENKSLGAKISSSLEDYLQSINDDTAWSNEEESTGEEEDSAKKVFGPYKSSAKSKRRSTHKCFKKTTRDKPVSDSIKSVVLGNVPLTVAQIYTSKRREETRERMRRNNFSLIPYQKQLGNRKKAASHAAFLQNMTKIRETSRPDISDADEEEPK